MKRKRLPLIRERRREVQGQLFHIQRRSQRISLGMSVLVYGHQREKQSFQEEAQTVTVNAHGGLLSMATLLAKGQKLILTNLQSMQEVNCHVAYLGPTENGKTQIGVEFIQPSPRFWGIPRPPDDWDLAQVEHH